MFLHLVWIKVFSFCTIFICWSYIEIFIFNMIRTVLADIGLLAKNVNLNAETKFLCFVLNIIKCEFLPIFIVMLCN